MNDALKMQISAFVDGELPDNESELLLRRLSQDTELRQQVSRYLEIGRLLRRDRDVPGMDQLRGRIAAALGDELAQPDEAQKVVGSRLMTPATGVAVAATVAALALVGLSQLDGPVDPVLERCISARVGCYSQSKYFVGQYDRHALSPGKLKLRWPQAFSKFLPVLFAHVKNCCRVGQTTNKNKEVCFRGVIFSSNF